jgi:nucleotide-binding universal stress UspA family protein
MYTRILIVVDEGAVARAALSEGLRLAQVHEAEVLLLHVLPNYVVPVSDGPALAMVSPEQYREDVLQEGRTVLAAATVQAQQLGVKSSTAIGSDADAATCIANAAVEHGCGVIVVGSYGRGALQRLIFGSVVSRLTQLSPVPLLICKASQRAGQSNPDSLPAGEAI